jgi:hypothetical protein
VPDVDLGDVATWVGGIAAVVVAALAAGQALRRRAEARKREARRRMLPPWRIEPLSETRCHLVNDGDRDAFDVSIEGARLLMTGPARRQWGTIPAGEREEFYVFDIDQPTGDAVTVQWSWEPGGEQHRYKRALPRV